MKVKENIGGLVLDKAINYLSGDPESNLPKLLYWIDALGVKSVVILKKASNSWTSFRE
ncbi:MAG: hypothetical protein LBS62_13600 [Clostridiales bacterium]|jgi:hypothetical protein|nr:hypothetical protein [Clostridiales bacterium]